MYNKQTKIQQKEHRKHPRKQWKQNREMLLKVLKHKQAYRHIGLESPAWYISGCDVFWSPLSQAGSF